MSDQPAHFAGQYEPEDIDSADDSPIDINTNEV